MARLVKLANTKAGVAAQVDAGELALGGWVLQLSEPTVLNKLEGYIRQNGTSFQVAARVQDYTDIEAQEWIDNAETSATSKEDRAADLRTHVAHIEDVLLLPTGGTKEIES